ncbi:biofilm development regulator YmgB/AriR family protein [Erwinia amylovora]|uniref:Biofilm development protein YmgB/AriR n=4 Tax=Erwinia amylovora TaxID=552 RepID=A0A830ZR64_ERWAM|nr:biofilm development regulator YmgB/AriR family protein [Erwinia amylovora]CBX79759.1 hypothetical protein predicted by Glimmer/Critica [Erwinia amylovora ATCC BAA-2158]CCP02282.1 hypothetical protein BN439_1202 [Erwinia amylovora Ea644]CDK14479.1 hypothetical protein LA635_0855 [Erwinia amylovora LA635]CDK17846.1 hypothetical protein LA636_0854 [Erwinia amylovora LA636]CDK21215.1 hypothetical protein LA637_0855 [Erwinia amylovora LA637]
MNHQLQGAGRAITDYFNSPSFHPVQESELLEAIMVELMQSGTPASTKAIIAKVIARLGREPDKSLLLDCRKLLAELLNVKE